MKYLLIWMLCFGVPCGLADEDDADAIINNPVLSFVFAPTAMAAVIVNRIGD